MKLAAKYLPSFERDVKNIAKKHVDLSPLTDVIDLIIINDASSLDTLRRRHNMHNLAGNWKGHKECHVANAGDWLVIWQVAEDTVIFERTGSHDDLLN